MIGKSCHTTSACKWWECNKLFGKADLFNKLFADQCTPYKNLNKLPPLYLKADKNCVTSTVIGNIDPDKYHGWDNLSVKIINLRDDSLIYSLIYVGALEEGKYPDCWKKAIVIPVLKKEIKVPVHKKEIKSLIKNYRVISLLPVLGKIFERKHFRAIRLNVQSWVKYLGD